MHLGIKIRLQNFSTFDFAVRNTTSAPKKGRPGNRKHEYWLWTNEEKNQTITCVPFSLYRRHLHLLKPKYELTDECAWILDLTSSVSYLALSRRRPVRFSIWTVREKKVEWSCVVIGQSEIWGRALAMHQIIAHSTWQSSVSLTTIDVCFGHQEFSMHIAYCTV